MMKKRMLSLMGVFALLLLIVPQAAFVPVVNITLDVSTKHLKAPENQVVCTVTLDTNYDGRTTIAMWTKNGEPIPNYTNNNFVLENGRTSTYKLNVPFTRDFAEPGARIGFIIFYDNEQVSAEQYITFENITAAEYDRLEEEARLKAEEEKARKRQEALDTVKTIEVTATINAGTSVYSNMTLTSKSGSLSKGTAGVYVNYYQKTTSSGGKQKVSGKLRLSNGNTVWVPYNKLSISTANFSATEGYSEEIRTNFVNAKGYASDTGYLVWINLKTQTVSVFTGQKENWVLDKTYTCATGRNTNPTIAGVFKYHTKVAKWDFGSYYVNTVLIFNGGHAMHTRTYTKKTGALLDATMGRPVSSGCVRMLDNDVKWLSDNLPLYSTVVVF